MRRRTGWLLVAGVIALAIGGFALRRDDAPLPSPLEAVTADAAADATPPHPASQTSDAVTGSPAVVVGGSSASAAAPGVAAVIDIPLPPPDTPIATILDELERRARSGDARAACRLAGELGRCATLARRLAAASQPQYALTQPGGSQADPKQLERYVDFAARQQLELERDQALCADVPRERLREAAPWMLAAARGGSPAAQVAYAQGLWTMIDPYAMRHADVLAAYSREAERIALASVEAGAPELLPALGMAYAGQGLHGPLASVVEPDPVRGHALLRMALGPRAGATPHAAARPAGADGTPAPPRPEQRAFEQLDAQLDARQRAASDALYARLSTRRAEHEARQTPRSRPPSFVNSLVQPEYCDR